MTPGTFDLPTIERLIPKAVQSATAISNEEIGNLEDRSIVNAARYTPLISKALKSLCVYKIALRSILNPQTLHEFFTEGCEVLML